MTDLHCADRLQQAFDDTAAKRAALDPDTLASINLDVPTAVTTVIGALPEIRTLRSTIVEELPRFDVTTLDQLEEYAFATAQAHAVYMTAAAPSTALTEINEQAATLRDTIMSDAAALAKRGVIDAKRLTEFKGLTGYRHVAFDLIGLSTMLREHWSEIATKTALQSSELDEARALADKLITGVAVRDQPIASLAATDVRQRAFTLLVRAYDEVRAAVIYLRRHAGDADVIAPSLYAGRNKGRKSEHPPVASKATPPVAAGQTILPAIA